jgi:hypothetical protein
VKKISARPAEKLSGDDCRKKNAENDDLRGTPRGHKERKKGCGKDGLAVTEILFFSEIF